MSLYYISRIGFISIRNISLLRYSALRCFSAKTAFEEAQVNLKSLKKDPGVDVKLKLYGLFKQASVGNATGKRPSALDFITRAKFDAWKSLEGVSQEDAQKQYVKLVSSLVREEKKSVDEAVSIDGLKLVPGLNVSVEGKAFRIQLNRPEKFNAITWEMYRGLTDALKLSSKDKNTSVTVLTGTGEYYCSGNDLSNFSQVKSTEDIARIAEEGGKVLNEYVNAFITHEKPLIALINGPAIGIAVTVLALFDLVFASDKASFHTPFATLSQSPEACSSYTFPFLMGHPKAAEVLVFGRKLTAFEAFERNLVNEVLPAKTFITEAEKRVQVYSNLPPESLRLSKQLLRSVHKEALIECNQREVRLLTQRWQSKECMHSIQQFIARKK